MARLVSGLRGKLRCWRSNTRREEADTVASKKKKSKKTLTPQQKRAMQRHSQHHTPSHMREMTRLMLGGMTFTQAHRSAMRTKGR